MIIDFEQNTFWVFLALGVAGIFLILSIVFLFLWLANRRRLRKFEAEQLISDNTRMALELAVADQVGRMRLIKDLHEVALTEVNKIHERAEGAKLATANQDDFSSRSFSAIEVSSKEVLVDMRRVLKLVSDGEQLAKPEPRLRAISDLLQTMKDAGLVINSEETGQSYRTKPGIELAVFRVVQESLENSLKHGGIGTEVWLRFIWGANDLRISIDDDGILNKQRLQDKKLAATKSKSKKNSETAELTDDSGAFIHHVSGPGLEQMKTRAEIFGGYLNAHEIPGVGFSISVIFPEIRLTESVVPNSITPRRRQRPISG